VAARPRRRAEGRRAPRGYASQRRTATARSMRFPSRHEFAAALVGGAFTNSKTNYVTWN